MITSPISTHVSTRSSVKLVNAFASCATPLPSPSMPLARPTSTCLFFCLTVGPHTSPSRPLVYPNTLALVPFLATSSILGGLLQIGPIGQSFQLKDTISRMLELQICQLFGNFDFVEYLLTIFTTLASTSLTKALTSCPRNYIAKAEL